MTVAPPDEALAAALLDSRLRWRDFALLAADLLFETDAAGRFTFIAPDPVLGLPAQALIGMPARALLAEPEGPDPFAAANPAHGLRAWLLPAEGPPVCLEFMAMRVGDGLRGAARDVTAEERQVDAAARALRRATALGRLLGTAQCDRGQGAAAAALMTLLAGLMPALGCGGAALLAAEGGAWRIAATTGEAMPAALGALPPPGALAGQPWQRGEMALLRAGAELGLLAWRDPPLEADDLGVLAALAAPLAALHLEAERQRDLDAAARTDGLTGLLNRRGFLAALADRLAAGPLRGTLAYLDLDALKPLNDRLGHEAGDAALRSMAERLATVMRPGDLAARLGGDEFALWLEGADAEAAALRCLHLSAPGALPGWPEAGPAALVASLGLAQARLDDSVEMLLSRADGAMYRVKHARHAA